MIRAAYFDYFNNSINEQIELFQKSNQETLFVLRKIKGKSFFHFALSEIKKIIKNVEVKILDFSNYLLNIKGNDLNKLKAVLLGTEIDTIIIELDSELSDMENILYVRKIQKEFPNLKIILKFSQTREGVEIKRFFEGIKGNKVKLYFDPVNIYFSKLSYTLEYRLLKKEIGFIALSDIDNYDEPTLLGYGSIDLLDFFKRLFDHFYQGVIALDTNLFNIMENFDKEEKTYGAITRRKKHKNRVQFFIQKIKPDAKEITMDEIFLNQIKVLNEIFKID